MRSPSPSSRFVATGIIVAVAFLSWPHPALPQGPLTPPGAPAPTMKTLDQVEPRIPITTLPITISTRITDPFSNLSY